MPPKAPKAPPPKHGFIQTGERGRCLVAAVDISKGAEIISEKPLASLRVGLNDIYNPDSFFNRHGDYHGLRAITKMHEDLTNPERTKFNKLQNSSPLDNPAGIMLTNCFRDDRERQDGHLMATLNIYFEISRANHSCRPNAVYCFNPDTQTGSLRALRPIQRNAEIFIEYLGDEESSLCDYNTRDAQYQAHYRFACNCVVCGGRANDRARDSRLRVEAGQMHNAIKAEQSRHHDDETEAERHKRLQHAEKYVTTLRDGLHVSDAKLSSAYKHLADIHRQGYEIAKRDGTEANHCRPCKNNGGARHHIKLARDAFESMAEVDIVCYGSDHPEYKKNQKHFDELTHLLATTA